MYVYVHVFCNFEQLNAITADKASFFFNKRILPFMVPKQGCPRVCLVVIKRFDLDLTTVAASHQVANYIIPGFWAITQLADTTCPMVEPTFTE